MSVYGTIASGIINGGLSALNNHFAQELAEQDRRENYMYGEMAAENADRRTRMLYGDFYSPEALMKQYKAAGLSPGMMFGGTPGQGGVSGAQGTGAHGIQTPYMPISLVDAAQAAALTAQAQKTKAETKNIEKDTYLKELETQLQEMANGQYKTEWDILNSTWTLEGTNEPTSIFELANKHYSYESFLNAIRSDSTDSSIKQATTTEVGQKILRSIYEGANKFHRDIAVLSSEELSAHFQSDIIKALNKKGFQDLNAEAAIAQLKQEISTNELTETQKEAWNNLINRLGSKGSTTRDIIVVLGMILGNFASHTGIKVNVGK